MLYKYDYISAISEDIKSYITDNYNIVDVARRMKEDRDEFFEELNDLLWVEDSVTGNASGSYFCNAYKAEEAICHNWDILAEALKEFGCSDVITIEKGAEWCDVTIRCYLLGEALSSVLDKLDEEFATVNYFEDICTKEV